MKNKTELTPAQRRARNQLWIERTVLFLILMTPFLVMASTATTGNTNGLSTTFLDDAYNWLKAIILGTGGKLIALLFFVVGLVIYLSKQSLFAFLTGLAAAFLIAVFPGMVETVFAAVL